MVIHQLNQLAQQSDISCVWSWYQHWIEFYMQAAHNKNQIRPLPSQHAGQQHLQWRSHMCHEHMKSRDIASVVCVSCLSAFQSWMTQIIDLWNIIIFQYICALLYLALVSSTAMVTVNMRSSSIWALKRCKNKLRAIQRQIKCSMEEERWPEDQTRLSTWAVKGSKNKCKVDDYSTVSNYCEHTSKASSGVLPFT